MDSRLVKVVEYGKLVGIRPLAPMQFEETYFIIDPKHPLYDYLNTVSMIAMESTSYRDFSGEDLSPGKADLLLNLLQSGYRPSDRVVASYFINLILSVGTTRELSWSQLEHVYELNRSYPFLEFYVKEFDFLNSLINQAYRAVSSFDTQATFDRFDNSGSLIITDLGHDYYALVLSLLRSGNFKVALEGYNLISLLALAVSPAVLLQEFVNSLDKYKYYQEELIRFYFSPHTFESWEASGLHNV